MMTTEIVVTTNKKNNLWKLRASVFSILVFSMSVFLSSTAFAHCDTMDGPLIADAKRAIEKNNVNYVLKWVMPEHEKEIVDVFNLSMKVRGLSPEATEISEKYFFDVLVRVHRSGEGVPFTGVKPSGTPIDAKILAADKSIEVGNLSPLEGKVAKKDLPELTKRFKKVISLKNYDVNDVKAGREYIEAYVQFFKFAEGEEHADESHGQAKHSSATKQHHAH